MTKYVQFRARGGTYAIAAEHVLRICAAADIVLLPSPAPDVVGLISFDDKALTVMSAFGTEGDHVLIIDDTSGLFGVVVTEVTTVLDVDVADIAPRPLGQYHDLVCGVLTTADGLTLVVDIDALAAMLLR